MAYDASQKPEQDVRERIFLPELLRGLAITTKHFLRNFFGQRDPNTSVVDRQGPNLVTTIQYPEERVPYPPGYRGLHRLVPREDGKPRCVACYMCATVCPAQCIYIEAGAHPDADPSAQPRVCEQFAARVGVDERRCPVAACCVESRPTHPDQMGTFPAP